MSREIKFRVWDKRCKCYLPTKSYHIFWLDNDVFRVCIHEPSLDMPRDSVVLQQYTGLKDKHGVEIYEGDIVHYVFDGASYPKEAEDKVLICKWDQGNAWFVFDETLDKHVDGYYWLEIKGYCKVVGNIFENPELLEQ